MSNSELKVLLVEDDIDYASLLHLRLTRVQAKGAHLPELQITHVRSLAEALAQLSSIAIDLILLDITLPDAKELEGLERLKNLYPYIPVVVLTVTDNDKLAVAALQLGAQDYLIKDEIDILLLLRAMRHAVTRGDLLAAKESKYIQELQTSDANLQNIVRRISDGIAVVSISGVIEFANPAFAAFLGINQNEYIGQTFAHTLTDNGVSEIQAQGHDGALRTLEMHVSSVLWHDKEAYLVLLHEITSQKQTVLAMEQYARELEVHNEDLDAFAHTVAHNLKAPLTHIILAADLLDLNRDAMDGDCGQYVKTIVNYSRKMTDIIDELLLLAEVRAREDLLLLPLNMARLVHDVEARLKSLILQYNAQIILPDDIDEWPKVIGYGPWIEEVWANYLTNGIKFGGRPPRIKVGSTSLPNGTVRFWVQDNGEGITPEEQRNLFQPFARLRPFGTEGQGLGLSIVRRIIEKLGGEVGLESEVGRGSTFSFTLPLA
ncbi:MAG: ATP-binding protein [Caldilineaceae bacterium]